MSKRTKAVPTIKAPTDAPKTRCTIVVTLSAGAVVSTEKEADAITDAFLRWTKGRNLANIHGGETCVRCTTKGS